MVPFVYLMHFVRREGVTVHFMLIDFEAILDALLEAHGVQDANSGHRLLIIQRRLSGVGGCGIDAYARSSRSFQYDHSLLLQIREGHLRISNLNDTDFLLGFAHRYLTL